MGEIKIKKVCNEGHHCFVAEDGKGLLDVGEQVCTLCGVKR